jgi:hypothetical protein
MSSRIANPVAEVCRVYSAMTAFRIAVTAREIALIGVVVWSGNLQRLSRLQRALSPTGTVGAKCCERHRTIERR